MWPFKRRLPASTPELKAPTQGRRAPEPAVVDVDPDVWSRLRSSWLAQDVELVVPPSPAAMDGAARRFGLTSLPPEVRDYLNVSDGTGGAMDNYTYAFWPLTRWEVCRTGKLSDEPYAIVAFADYSIESWWYAVTLFPSRTGTVYVADGPELEPFPHTSFAHWLTQYVTDPDSVNRPRG